MISFDGESTDSIATKKDTLIFIKDILEEKNDSISKLPDAEQQNLRRMENYKMQMKMDSDKNELRFNLAVDFKSIEDANYSLDTKTIEVTRSFLAYMKDPNILDLEIELEK
ncbi:MAG: hypothetical protein ACI840_001813 [Ulvibacter sp.]|jgi:hypothetical protein